MTKDQAVLVGAGNGATIVYHKIFEEAGKGDVLTAETAGNFFPARVTGAGESTIGLPLAPKGVTSFPPQRAAEAAERFAEVWELNPCGSMMDALFNGPNLICHSAGLHPERLGDQPQRRKVLPLYRRLVGRVSERYGRALGGKGPCL